MRALLIASILGLIAAFLTFAIATALLAVGVILGLVGLLFTLTGIGAILGIPLMAVGLLGVVLGAAGAGGAAPAFFFGAVIGLVAYLHLRRRERSSRT